VLGSSVWTAASAYVRAGETRGVFVATLEVAGRTVCVVTLTHCRSANPHTAEGKKGQTEGPGGNESEPERPRSGEGEKKGSCDVGIRGRLNDSGRDDPDGGWE